jgi:beta-galactosidase
LKQALVAALVLLSFPRTFGQAAFRPDQMNTVLYGAAYYPEYMPYERLDKDIELMKQAGITVVRMGESSWGL